MCLALPMRITAVDGQLATIAAEGLEQRCSLMLLPDADVGDYVLVHAGYAISRVDEDEARETYELLAEIGLAEMGVLEVEASVQGSMPGADRVDRGGRSTPEGGPQGGSLPGGGSQGGPRPEGGGRRPEGQGDGDD